MEDTIYGSQTLANDEFRLIKIEFQPYPSGIFSVIFKLQTFRLSEAPDYQALSYCWGDPETEQHMIKINGIDFSIRPNLSVALQKITPVLATSGRSEMWLWIDAIAINQSDIEERNAQVQLMPKIYSSAERVFIWLGDEAEESGKAFTLIQKWANFLATKDLGEFLKQNPGVLDNDSWKAVQKVLDRPWWNRAWILQEVFLAKVPIILCGNDMVFWNDFAQASETWFSISKDNHAVLNAQQLDMIKYYSKSSIWGNVSVIMFYEKMTLDGIIPPKTSADDSFLDMVNRCTARAASDPRDKIYAFIGIYPLLHIRVNVDYSKPIFQVYAEFVQSVIDYTSKLDILTYGNSTFASATHLPDIDLPSWVPDFRSRWQVDAPDGFDYRHYAASGTGTAMATMSADWRTLKVKGVLIDKIEKISPQLDFDDFKHLHESWGHFANLKNSSTYVTGISMQEAFFQTMIGFSKSMEKRDGVDAYMRFRSGFLYHIHKLDWFEQAKEGMLMVKDWLVKKTDSKSVPGLWEHDYVRRFVEIALHRQFFITAQGYFGIGPHWMEVDDQICIPLGRNVPLLIRRDTTSYRLVGECYVCGLVEGEAMARLHSGEVKLEELKFC